MVYGGRGVRDGSRGVSGSYEMFDWRGRRRQFKNELGI
jgi:hypothetical protein